MIDPTPGHERLLGRSANMASSAAVKFSLVLATVGRTSELDRFLEHLRKQSYKLFELIVVDQNTDDRLLPLLEPYRSCFPVIHCKSAIGLSRARNVGLQLTSGNVIAFPDDDCWYSEDLLERVASLFLEDSTVDCITGRPLDPRAHGFHVGSGPVNRWNAFRRGISYTIFIRQTAVAKVGGFDESLGLGAQSGKIAAEETDYLIRALSACCRVFYHADLRVFHGDSQLVFDNGIIKRQYGTGLGFGYVLRKHHYPIPYVLYSWLRPLGAAGMFALTFRFPRARYHYSAFKGRVEGWLG